MATHEPFEVWKANLEARGEAKGVALGKAEGVALGEAKGLALGEARGKVEGLMTSLVIVYTRRFGPHPQDLEEALARLVTVDTAAAWIGLMLSAPTAEAVAEAVRSGKPTG